MAEVLGALASGLTVAGLLKLCLEAFEIIQVARKQTFDLEKLCLRLNIERARLYTWGQTMNLISDQPSKVPNKSKAFPFENLVTSALRMILSLFEDGERLKKRYGCSVDTARVADNRLVTVAPHSASGFVSVDTFVESFGNFRMNDKQPSQASRLATKARWYVTDRTKFPELIQEIRGLIDGLQDITKSISTVARQEGVLRYSIQQIRDADTLNLLTEVCQQDYPDISDAASTKLDVMTISTHKLEAIEVWMDSTSSQVIDTENDLESMSITELQQLVRTLAVRRPDTDIIPGDNFYDVILQEKNRLIKEQEARIASMTESAKERDAIISRLKSQARHRPQPLQLPTATATTTTELNSLDRIQEGQIAKETNELTNSPAPETVEHQPSVEIFKSFRVGLEDSTYQVLPAALRKYKIMADWRNYSLYIVVGDQERCMGLEEKPLAVFKELGRQGQKPMFMLRKHAIVNPANSTAVPSMSPTDTTNNNGPVPGRI